MIKKTNLAKNKIPAARRIAFGAIFTALALVLSIVESYFPIGLLIPVPGIKLGLANIVTVFAIVTLAPIDTIIIIVIRCLIMGSITGPVSFLFSIMGALLAFLVMLILVKGLGSVFSVVGISMGGAVAHNIGQIAAAVFVMKDAGLIFSYLPFLMLIALFTGALTGFAAIPVIKNTEKILMKYTLNTQ